MSEFTEDPERQFPRANYIIPCLLKDTETNVYLKAVMLNLSATGCRIFTNDKRVRIMGHERLIGKTFRIEFDFYDVATDGIEGKVLHVKPGKDAVNERQLGIEFTEIDAITRRDINRAVRRDLQHERETKPLASGPKDFVD
jgi:c-di-GMP-binding flagellar brake protein YcgR